MANLDPAVREETVRAAVWTVALSVPMEAVFLVMGKWDPSVLLGNLGGGAVAVGNIFLLGWVISQALAKGDEAAARSRVELSKRLRMLGMAGLCALLIGAFHTNVYATLIPLLFPRIGMTVRMAKSGKHGGLNSLDFENPAEEDAEGSDLID